MAAIDDRNYYIFDVDLYLSEGKIEFRYSGDEIKIYGIGKHHLFSEFNELNLEREYNNVLSDNCIKNALQNISRVLEGIERPFCTVEDAIYPLYVAAALERSYKSGERELVEK